MCLQLQKKLNNIYTLKWNKVHPAAVTDTFNLRRRWPSERSKTLSQLPSDPRNYLIMSGFTVTNWHAAIGLGLTTLTIWWMVIYVAVIVLWLMPPVEMIASFSQALLLGVGRVGAGKGNGLSRLCVWQRTCGCFQSWLYVEKHTMKWTFSWLSLKKMLLSTNLVILKTIILIIKTI